MIISQLPELFVQRERALLGPRFDAMFSYPGQGAVRGASVNAMRCTCLLYTNPSPRDS